MRQFLFLLCFFSCASILADHDGSPGYTYNGRIPHCDNYDQAKRFSENAKKLSRNEPNPQKAEGAIHYNFALCQIYHGPKQLMAGIDTFQKLLKREIIVPPLL